MSICAPAVCVATKTWCKPQIHKRHHLKKNVPMCSSAYLRICLRAKEITALDNTFRSAVTTIQSTTVYAGAEATPEQQSAKV